MISIDFISLFELMNISMLRQPRIKAFFDVIAAELNLVMDQFDDLFVWIKYDLKFNGQVINLERYLNDVYDPTLRRIRINDGDEYNRRFIFNEIENNEETFVFNESEGESPLYVNNQVEQQSAVTFRVMIPNDITFNELIFRRHVDKYRLGGKVYELVIV